MLVLSISLVIFRFDDDRAVTFYFNLLIGNSFTVSEGMFSLLEPRNFM